MQKTVNWLLFYTLVLPCFVRKHHRAIHWCFFFVILFWWKKSLLYSKLYFFTCIFYCSSGKHQWNVEHFLVCSCFIWPSNRWDYFLSHPFYLSINCSSKSLQHGGSIKSVKIKNQQLFLGFLLSFIFSRTGLGYPIFCAHGSDTHSFSTRNNIISANKRCELSQSVVKSVKCFMCLFCQKN